VTTLFPFFCLFVISYLANQIASCWGRPYTGTVTVQDKPEARFVWRCLLSRVSLAVAPCPWVARPWEVGPICHGQRGHRAGEVATQVTGARLPCLCLSLSGELIGALGLSVGVRFPSAHAMSSRTFTRVAITCCYDANFRRASIVAEPGIKTD
jgi:hypothetical protein